MRITDELLQRYPVLNFDRRETAAFPPIRGSWALSALSIWGPYPGGPHPKAFLDAGILLVPDG